MNVRYRSNVRVIDYFPSKLEDFAKPHRISINDMLSDNDSSDSDIDSSLPLSATQLNSQDEEIKWEWRFGLVVEDGTRSAGSKGRSPTLQIIVTQKDADFLLRMEAVE